MSASHTCRRTTTLRTLCFLFFESDFRLNEEHCLEPDVWLPLVLKERVGGEPAASSSSRATGSKGEPDASLLELVPYGEPNASLTDGDIEEEIFGHVTQGTGPEKYGNAVYKWFQDSCWHACFREGHVDAMPSRACRWPGRIRRLRPICLDN